MQANMIDEIKSSRRDFIKNSALLSGFFLLPDAAKAESLSKSIPVYAHLWVYASAFPPTWDSTPVLDTVFSDLSYAGIEGVELMEINLKGENSVNRLKELISKYNLPVSGTSYNAIAPMWVKSNHEAVINEFSLVADRLKSVNGKTVGISVGDARRKKTEDELDVQAEVLQKMLKVCEERGLVPNIHNHTYEIEHDLHDLKGMLTRVPELKLGPDLNWLIRGGVNPVDFINTYGKRIVYLHIRDQYADGTWTENVGQGATDFNAIAKALKQQSFRGQAAIELAFPNNFKPINPLKKDWKISREFVRRTFG
ncbi:sugar phosphate isomerase/epimerase family protein [Hymenobacter terrenus]|uniref:sugar phosphate isomerase/epimerase family protein n=1 Tax=Hymenobacter terrenus TaxID=1629124 RepID=UPI000A9511C8|nr:TIM barrel protein [Hymenobacter terrenus]